LNIQMRSAGFDPYLDISLEESGGNLEPLSSNDDASADSFDAGLKFTAPREGLYIVRAFGMGGGTGEYELTTKARREHQAATKSPLTGDRASGTLDDNSPFLEGDAPHAVYTMAGKGGERIRLEIRTEGKLRPYLFLFREDIDFIRMNSVETSQKGLAEIVAVLPQQGEYDVYIVAGGPEEAGKFDLKVERGGPFPAPPRVSELSRTKVSNDDALALSDPNVGIAKASAASEEIAYFYRDYRLPVRKGEKIAIRLTSEDFDPVLEAGELTPLGFAVAESSDDAINGDDAQLFLTPASKGTIFLRVRGTGPSLGKFKLSVADQPTESINETP